MPIMAIWYDVKNNHQRRDVKPRGGWRMPYYSMGDYEAANDVTFGV